jgi:PAS domain S-box-containing protein
MVHTMTATGGVEFVNQRILDFLGKTVDELDNWDLLLHPDDRSRVIHQWTHSVATGEPYEAEHRVLCADGTYRWLLSRGLPLRDTSGNIVRWYNLLTDIDERKRAEEALKASERNLKLIIDTIPALAWSARADGSAEFFNQHYLDFIGLGLERRRSSRGHERFGCRVAAHYAF